MAQNVTVAGASYSAVPSVDLPTTGGGTSSFYDVSDTTATASDVASGKVFYDASGALTTGTASGGGSGGGSMSDPIRFFDYDGTVVASYTSVPSELPANPSHSGLVAQGWNHTLAQIQTQFAATGTCDIGQMYITESGDTEIDVLMVEGRLSPYLSLAPKGTVTIDWGDGSAVSTVTGTSLTSQKNTQHTYATAGDYTIKIHVSSGKVSLYCTTTYTLLHKNSSTPNQNIAYSNCVRAVRIGADTSIGNYAFYGCYSLAAITIPSGTSIGTYVFRTCYSLATVTIPSGVTSIGTYLFRNCYSLTAIAIPSVVTSIGDYAFSYCSLATVTIPSGVTSIGSSAFSYNYSLAAITIPDSVTSIGSSAFSSCFGLGGIHFKGATPPSVSNANAWTNVPPDCKIYVPSGSLSAYTSAANYPSSSTYTYVEE